MRRSIIYGVHFNAKDLYMTKDKSNLKLSQFESSLEELENIVERIERGDQSLEESIDDFERGMKLSQQCRVSLTEAEQRVEQLIQKHGEYSPEPFDPEQE